MKLSVIVPWYDSGVSTRQASWWWLANRYKALLPDAELLVGDRPDYVGYTTAEFDDPRFNRARARNYLFGISTGDVLLIADADTVFHPEQIKAGLELIAKGAPWVIAYGLSRYYNLSRCASAAVLMEPPDATIDEPTNPAEWEHKIDSWAGLLLVPRTAFTEAGGYDEQFTGWGYEDNAFRAALDHRVGPHQRADGYALHLWHPVKDEETFGQPHIAANRSLYQQYESGALP